MADKILVVDDDQDLRNEMRCILEDYEVIDSSNGRDVLKLLERANEIGLIFLDIMMPGVNGLDVLSEIKRKNPNLRTVIVTGNSSKDFAIEALKSRADDYLEKPVCVDRIKELAEKYIGNVSSQQETGALDLKSKIRKIEQFVERNCFKKTGLADAAKSIYLSPKYLSRIFKEETGVGFSEYKLKIKFEKSKELLAKTTLNINQISDKLGYENTESFIRQFKKYSKLTPTEYRKKIHKTKLKNRKKNKVKKTKKK